VTLEVVAGGRDPHGPNGQGPRILADGAPPSPGPLPNDLAMHLGHGEPLVWWGENDRFHWAPLLLALGSAVAALAAVTAFVPELWTQPVSSLWPPVLAVFSPALFVIVRELLSKRAVLVTDSAVVEVTMSGEAHRLSFESIRAVRRDVLRGGVRLDGAREQVRVPGPLLDDTRAAIASQWRRKIRTGPPPDDPLRWLP
jgi:hypothetical protein